MVIITPATYRDPSAGRLILTPGGYHAFVPAAPPPALEYDSHLILSLSRADAALGGLAGLTRALPSPDFRPRLLIAPYLRREAVLSSRIEGTRTSLAELLLDEATPDTARRQNADLREVANYVAALEYGVRRLAELPLSLRLVRELHERLMTGVRGDEARPGEFRTVQNWIGRPGSTPGTAIYVPPPPREMMEALHAWEAFLHERGTVPDLVQCALMHEHFEAIHPFVDGNGRVGRLLITLFLIERGRLPEPMFYLSAYLERHRSDYYDLLQGIRTRGAWLPWLRFFLAGVEETARAVTRQVIASVELRESYRARLPGKRRALALLDALFDNPYVTVARAEKLLGVSNPTARQAVADLQRAGLLREITGRTWGRTYLAEPIMRIIDPEED